ncbi:hypothetical protein RFI_26262 [Reticulomyxa filosa]|uniref:Uncharacterized protein n=1 Tax=Reticulomyxa filosa TaxID=46433 RepID=X6MDJ2_RETFI|nr:hypothetical protein RFI_26262 [Reticulomyxa filosa]|eukprot:ETO11115.1 hypothetical protein RFI_26262 [Reticulomyxa filosa]
MTKQLNIIKKYFKLDWINWDLITLITTNKFNHSMNIQKICIMGNFHHLMVKNLRSACVLNFYNQERINRKYKAMIMLVVILNLFIKGTKKEIKVIIKYWIRILNIKLGWIHEFDKLAVNYVIFDIFCSLSKLLMPLKGHTKAVWSIDYFIFDNNPFICSGSSDDTVCIWDVETNKQIQVFNKHLGTVYCVKFSPYHYYNYHQNVTCSSSYDKTIRFWDIKKNKQLQIFNKHTGWIGEIKFSSFNSGRYLCSGSYDNTIRLWDVEAYKSLHVFKGHTNAVRCIDISPLRSNKSNNIGIIGGNGYTICSGSFDRTICIWDIETTKQYIVFKGHGDYVTNVKYGSNELLNTILSGSEDKSIRLWDIRSGKQIEIFNGHKNSVNVVEYSPFIIKNNSKVIDGNSNVICSGGLDDTIRFWDIRSNKNQLYMIKEENGILCLKFIQLKKNKICNNDDCINLCYGSWNGLIHIWG